MLQSPVHLPSHPPPVTNNGSVSSNKDEPIQFSSLLHSMETEVLDLISKGHEINFTEFDIDVCTNESAEEIKKTFDEVVDGFVNEFKSSKVLDLHEATYNPIYESIDDMEVQVPGLRITLLIRPAGTK